MPRLSSLVAPREARKTGAFLGTEIESGEIAWAAEQQKQDWWCRENNQAEEEFVGLVATGD